MNLHYFEHVPYEGLGHIDTWAGEDGQSVTSTKFHAGDSIPDIKNFDWLIVMGGPMSVHDESEYPWLIDEKRFINQAISEGKIVLGICLGAQLIADVLGAKVVPMPYKEIGWYPVSRTDESESTFFSQLMPESIQVFHWHTDTFDIPDGAVHIAQSEACVNQGFIYRDRVVGLQFHPEMTPNVATEIIRHTTVTLGEGRWVQTEKEMIDARARFYAANDLMSKILRELAGTA
jgi:GMP synthase (glutamine-hydrolysing)